MRNLIYGLIDPRTRLIRYVGLSATGMVRPRKHRNKTRHTGTTHRACWLRELFAAGLDYEIVTLQETETADDLRTAERWWIAFGRAWDLLSTERKAAAYAATAASKIGKPRSAETREKLRVAKLSGRFVRKER